MITREQDLKRADPANKSTAIKSERRPEGGQAKRRLMTKAEEGGISNSSLLMIASPRAKAEGNGGGLDATKLKRVLLRCEFKR